MGACSAAVPHPLFLQLASGTLSLSWMRKCYVQTILISRNPCSRHPRTNLQHGSNENALHCARRCFQMFSVIQRSTAFPMEAILYDLALICEELTDVSFPGSRPGPLDTIQRHEKSPTSARSAAVRVSQVFNTLPYGDQRQCFRSSMSLVRGSTLYKRETGGAVL